MKDEKKYKKRKSVPICVEIERAKRNLGQTIEKKVEEIRKDAEIKVLKDLSSLMEKTKTELVEMDGPWGNLKIVVKQVFQDAKKEYLKIVSEILRPQAAVCSPQVGKVYNLPFVKDTLGPDDSFFTIEVGAGEKKERFDIKIGDLKEKFKFDPRRFKHVEKMDGAKSFKVMKVFVRDGEKIGYGKPVLVVQIIK